nr:Chain A, Lectin Scafet Precursor [Hyacinthoides hispanica]1DLP_B Chain B, Lectin Scafet Precursor [Hyacinthoides hispanica]1DLP_C Chain C, Lectin Scafet Precursor [Hyacinthoides hispanica]1DLP_D Chain D, Lectin Scafet Precursor [Hyacinthoides hispanica]1DLP_E Chain E, Lectin Scafet Precursor [Hyacinthoides hispanica]1DLP_F Chain F, Lectin Scafet Precursor [Hyacinthoides hispanica]
NNILFGLSHEGSHPQTLHAAQSLELSSFRFTMQSDCNLVLFDSDVRVWASNTAGATGCRAVLQSDGLLVILTAQNTIRWSSGTKGSIGNYVLVLQPDRTVTIYGPGLWDSGTSNKGSVVVANNGNSILYSTQGNDNHPQTLHATQSLQLSPYRLSMETDCNLVLFDRDDRVWSTNTAGKGTGCRAVLQPNGRMDVLTNQNIAVWTSGNSRSAGRYVFVLQPDRNLAIYGGALWTTG